MKQKQIFIAAVVGLVAAFAVAAFVYKNNKGEQAAQLAAQNQPALNRSYSPTVGDPNAPVHIVEFFDPACGTCREFYPLIKALMASNPGKIRISERYAPFHPGSDQVVRMLEAARRQGKFEVALEALFSTQNDWVRDHAARPDLAWADLGGLGLDMDRLKNDMNSPDVAKLIEQDLADANTLKVTQTPEFFVNGKPLPSFGFDQLKQLVDEAVASSGGS
jgi:protein-disulfide isomerase